MAPVVDRLSSEYEGAVEFKLLNVETDEGASSIASQFRVQYVPTFVFVDSNGNVTDTIVGETTEAELKAALDALQ